MDYPPVASGKGDSGYGGPILPVPRTDPDVGPVGSETAQMIFRSPSRHLGPLG